MARQNKHPNFIEKDLGSEDPFDKGYVMGYEDGYNKAYEEACDKIEELLEKIKAVE